MRLNKMLNKNKCCMFLTAALLIISILTSCGSISDTNTDTSELTTSEKESSEEVVSETTYDASRYVDRYLALFNTDHCWQDPTISIRYVLLNDNSVVILLLIPGSPDVWSYPYSSISYYTTIETDFITTITITTNSGYEEVINIASEESEEFLRGLNEKMK